MASWIHSSMPFIIISIIIFIICQVLDCDGFIPCPVNKTQCQKLKRISTNGFINTMAVKIFLCALNKEITKCNSSIEIVTEVFPYLMLRQLFGTIHPYNDSIINLLSSDIWLSCHFLFIFQ